MGESQLCCSLNFTLLSEEKVILMIDSINLCYGTLDACLKISTSAFTFVHTNNSSVIMYFEGDLINDFLYDRHVKTKFGFQVCLSCAAPGMLMLFLLWPLFQPCISSHHLFQVACWMTACERQTDKIRKAFFQAILRQEIAWFDKHKSGELTTRLAEYDFHCIK